MVSEESSPVQSDDVPAWKRSFTVPLGDDHPSCAHPGAIDNHDDLHRTLDVVRKAYDWCITADGSLAGLVSGDMGWSVTNIRLKPEDIHENMKKPENQE